jgi:uncharacterized protein
MKFLLILLVVGVGLYLLLGRGRSRTGNERSTRGKPGPAPAAMLACAHCGVHLPSSEALVDAAGRSYCGEPHRLAGPR